MRSVKKVRNVLLVTMLLCFVLTLPVLAAYNYDVKIMVNGIAIDFPDQKPYIDSSVGRTFVPVRFVSEALGAEVGWEQDTQTAVINRGDQIIRMKIGTDRPTVNGQEKILDAPARITGDRTMVPLRFISEVLGAVVNWDPATRTVSISDGQNSKPYNPNEYYQINGYTVPKNTGFYILTFDSKENRPICQIGLDMKGEKLPYATQLEQARGILESKHGKAITDQVMVKVAEKTVASDLIFGKYTPTGYEIWVTTNPGAAKINIMVFQM